MSKRKFKTEVNQLLDLIIHNLYTHSEIFLRELVSNSSDALDKLKYLNLTDDEYKKIKFDPKIEIRFDESKDTLSVSDTGIGMSQQELEKNLGTIARSGTRDFLKNLSGDESRDSNLIGQFGVGFYSSFMAADEVEVLTRRAGEDQAWLWKSDGRSSYEIEESERPSHGTTVILHLNENGKEYASRWRIQDIIRKYSNHIPFPIILHYYETTTEGEGDDKKEKKRKKKEQINAASALWTKPRSELKDKDYHEFYKTISHDSDDPMLYLHTHAEGTQEYTTLFYVPAKAPFDMFFADYRPGVKLYIKRVFITDDDKELLPQYLRFIRGVIDSEDLPLNVSRETLQHNKIMSSIRNASVKKILGELASLQTKDPEKYQTFYEEYHRPIKEGLYQDYANRDGLLDLVMYKSTLEDGYTTLSQYKDRMPEDQKAIYFITGENEATLRNSPLLEAYRKNSIEVLIMDDEIDEIVAPSVGQYKDTPLKSVNRSDAAEDLKSEGDKQSEKDAEPLVKKIKKILGDEVKDVRASTRLSDSPSCIVADESDPTIQMQHILKSMGQEGSMDAKPILEVNPTHEIFTRLAEIEDSQVLEDASRLLLEQALLLEGAELKDPSGFVQRLNRVLKGSL